MRNRLLDLFLVNVLTWGLEICMATSTIYIPPMLLEAGVQERFMTMVLGVGPVLGLIFVPPLGSASDRWKSRYGRRRPFIWPLCVGVLLGLVVIPRASQIASLSSEQHQHWLEVLLLVLSICVLQFCGQACFTPLEALVSDLYPGEEESRQAFSIYSIMLILFPGRPGGLHLCSPHWTLPYVPPDNNLDLRGADGRGSDRVIQEISELLRHVLLAIWVALQGADAEAYHS